MLALTLLALALQTQQIPVRVSATLSHDDIVVGETTLLVIEIETGDVAPENVQLPAVPAGLEVVGTEEVTESRAAFPGGRTRVNRRTFLLAARVAGQFTIPRVRVRVAGRVWESDPLFLVVRAAAREAGGLEDSRMEVALTPERAWVGQQIVLEATASFARGLRARQTRPATYQAPSPAGFWIHDLPDPLTVGLRTIGGNVYETQTFRRAYFPLTAGSFVMPPAQLAFEFRRGFLGSSETRLLVSDSPRIVVMPVPRQNRPASFRGAVGRYGVSARLSPARGSVGEASTLIVEVAGYGNIKAIPPPVLPSVNGLDVHPPTEDATVTVSGDRVGGTKRFSWVVVPARAGLVRVPPIEYAFFDPDRSEYEVVRTDSLSLVVLEAGPRVPAARLAPIAGMPSRLVSGLRSPLFAVAQVVPLVLMVAAWYARRRRPFERRGRRTELSVLARLARLRRDPSSPETQFCTDLAAVIRFAFADRLGPQAQALAPDALRAAIDDAGLPVDAITTLLDVLAEADRARFSGAGTDRAQRTVLLDRTEAALRALERRWIGRAAPLILLVLATAAAAQVPAAPYARGVAAYALGNFDDAVASFRSAITAEPHDANAWHALGNALHQSDQAAAAIHAWLRAARIDPQHRGARTNLALTIGDDADAFLPPGLSLAWPAALWLITGGWWISGCAAAIALWRDRRVAGAFVPLGAVAVMALASALARSAVRPAAVSLHEATLLADPALKAETVGIIVPAGAAVTIVDRRAGWLRVRNDGAEGWVEADLFDEV